MWLLAGLGLFGLAFAALFPAARRLYGSLEERGGARGVTVGLLLVLAALLPLARLSARASDRLRERRLDAVAHAMRPVLDAVAAGAIGPLDESAPGETLLALLRGREIHRRPRIRTIPLDLETSASERLAAEGNFPFRPFQRALPPGEVLRFPVAQGPRVTRLGLALPPRVGGLSPVLDIAILRSGGERRALVLDSDAPRSHGWGEGVQLVEVRHVDVQPPVEDASVIEVRPRGVTTPLYGLCAFDGAKARALTPEDLTRTGLPVRMASPSGSRGIAIVPGAAPVEFGLDPPVDCDRLWLVYEVTDPREAQYRWFGEDIVDVRLDYADGRPSEQHTLKHGEDLHSANLDRSRHPDDLQSVVAFVRDEDGVRTHADQRLWVFSGPRQLKRVSLRNLSGASGYTVHLLGLTAGILDPTPDGNEGASESDPFVKDGPKVRLREALASQFLGVRLAYADRQGILRAAEADAAIHLEGASLEEGEVEGILAGRPCAARCGTLAGIDAEVAVLPVRIAGVVSGGIVLYVPEPNRGLRRGSFDLFPAIAILLTLPYLLVAFAESLSRGDRIRRKIAVALAVATLVPLAVVFLIVRGAFESSRERATQQKLQTGIQLLRERFVRERDLAAASAAAFSRAFREHPRVEPLFLPPPRPDAETVFRRELRAARERHASVRKTFVRLESRMPGSGTTDWKTLDDIADGFVKLDNVEFQATDYYVVQGRLVLVGVDRWTQGELRGRLALGTEVALPAEREHDAWLLRLDGKPLDNEDVPDGWPTERLRDLAEQAARRNKPVSWAGDGTCLLDVFRDRQGNPTFAYAIREGPGAGDIDLFGTRVPLGILLGFVTLLGAVAALAIARILTDRLTGPIETLASASAEARLGRRFVPAVTEATDEIGVLSEQLRAMSSELMRRIQHLDDIQNGMLGFAGRLRRDEVAREACRFAAVAARAGVAFLWIPEPASKEGFRVYDSRGQQRLRKATPLLQRIVAADAWTLVGDEDATHLEFLADADKDLTSTAVWGGPVRFGTREEGWLVLYFGNLPDAGQREAGRAAAHSIALVLENSRTYERAIEDPLTGAFVEAHFELRLSEAIERARLLARRLWVARVGLTPGLRANASAVDVGLRLIARRLVRFTRRNPSAFCGRMGAAGLVLVLEIEAAEKRDAWLRAFERVCRRHGKALELEWELRDALYPDDSTSSTALLERLRRGVLERGQRAVDLERFLGTAPPDSAAMRETVLRAARLSQVEIPVLLEGEPDVGKRELARRMHLASGGDPTNLVEVHLASLHPNLAEAELFGVEAGAYSGVAEKRIGLLERAQGGTLVLHEVGEAPLELQGKLLRALQDQKIRRLGSTVEIPLKFRLISTSSLDLKQRIHEGGFRQDFYYRIAGAEVHVPPLRARGDDIPVLAQSFLLQLGKGTVSHRLTPRALDRLRAHSWPGNLTELQSVLGRAALLAGSREWIDAEDLEIIRTRVPASGSASGGGRSEGAALRRASSPRGTGGSRLGRRPADAASNERQRRLLAMLTRGERITTTEYVRWMEVSPRTGLRDLAELVRLGRLRREGRKRGTTYRVL